MVGAGFIYLPRAEAAWLPGDLAACRAEARGMLDLLLDGMLWVLCSGARWQALPERAIRLAENWITSREYQRQQALRAVAEEQEEYTVKE